VTKSEKREAKIKASLGNVPLEDFEALAKKHGRIVEGGKHPHIEIGNKVMPYKRENPVKQYAVEALLALIDEKEKGGR
jgi:hypothetical protein